MDHRKNKTTREEELQRQLKAMERQNIKLLRQLKQDELDHQHDISGKSSSSYEESEVEESAVSSEESSSELGSNVTNSIRIPKPQKKDVKSSANLTGIPKPRGKDAKNIRKSLDLSKIEYQGYRSDLRDLIKAGVLDPNKEWKQQTQQEMKRVLNLIEIFKKKNPTFPKCINDWAIKEMARGIINNKREYSRDKKKTNRKNKNKKMVEKANDNDNQESTSSHVNKSKEDRYRLIIPDDVDVPTEEEDDLIESQLHKEKPQTIVIDDNPDESESVPTPKNKGKKPIGFPKEKNQKKKKKHSDGNKKSKSSDNKNERRSQRLAVKNR